MYMVVRVSAPKEKLHKRVYVFFFHAMQRYSSICRQRRSRCSIVKGKRLGQIYSCLTYICARDTQMHIFWIAPRVTKNLQNRIGKLYGRMHRANGRPVCEKCSVPSFTFGTLPSFSRPSPAFCSLACRHKKTRNSAGCCSLLLCPGSFLRSRDGLAATVKDFN